MSSSSLPSTAAGVPTAALPFIWLNPFKPTAFRVIVGLGLGTLMLLLLNVLSPAALTGQAYAWSLVCAIAAYLLAEVLLVALITVGPLLCFTYGAIAYFSH